MLLLVAGLCLAAAVAYTLFRTWLASRSKAWTYQAQFACTRWFLQRLVFWTKNPQFVDDDHLSASELAPIAQLIIRHVDRTIWPDYANDADVIYQDEHVEISLSSLYVIFNVEFLRDRNISAIVNMFGFANVKERYAKDLIKYSSMRTTVSDKCIEAIAHLARYGGVDLVDHYKQELGIDVFHVEGVEDDRDSNIQDHFGVTCDFIRAHMSVTKPAKVLINCYSGYNRSATIAIAFLLTHTGQPLMQLLPMVLPKRSNMLSRPTWPNKIQSKFVKELLCLDRQISDKSD